MVVLSWEPLSWAEGSRLRIYGAGLALPRGLVLSFLEGLEVLHLRSYLVGTGGVAAAESARFRAMPKRCVARSSKRIVLIDGEELARLMVKNGVGVRVRRRYETQRIDEDCFDC